MPSLLWFSINLYNNNNLANYTQFFFSDTAVYSSSNISVLMNTDRDDIYGSLSARKKFHLPIIIHEFVSFLQGRVVL